MVSSGLNVLVLRLARVSPSLSDVVARAERGGDAVLLCCKEVIDLQRLKVATKAHGSPNATTTILLIRKCNKKNVVSKQKGRIFSDFLLRQPYGVAAALKLAVCFLRLAEASPLAQKGLKAFSFFKTAARRGRRGWVLGQKSE